MDQEAKNKRLNQTKANRGLYLFVILLTIIFLKHNFTQAKYFIELNREFNNYQQQAQELKQGNLDLKAKLEYLQTQEFIEREARQKLSLGQESDTLYLLPEVPNLSKLKSSPESENIAVWQQWLNLFWY